MDENNSLVANLDLENRYNWGLFPTVEVERVFVAVYANGSYSVRAIFKCSRRNVHVKQ